MARTEWWLNSGENDGYTYFFPVHSGIYKLGYFMNEFCCDRRQSVDVHDIPNVDYPLPPDGAWPLRARA